MSPVPPPKPYLLTAQLHGRRRTHQVWANRDAAMGDDDFDATLGAIAHVLDEAVHDDVWKLGRVELWSPTGDLLHVMDAKA